ncbi:hypothetical protein J6590_061883 [Homalodisca vitripennis]|nr:hypothetical protein J6590_061883 [Homalodisca vitripennis]
MLRGLVEDVVCKSGKSFKRPDECPEERQVLGQAGILRTGMSCERKTIHLEVSDHAVFRSSLLVSDPYCPTVCSTDTRKYLDEEMQQICNYDRPRCGAILSETPTDIHNTRTHVHPRPPPPYQQVPSAPPTTSLVINKALRNNDRRAGSYPFIGLFVCDSWRANGNHPRPRLCPFIPFTGALYSRAK